MELIDYIIEVNDVWKLLKQKFTALFTVNIDPLNISETPIKFNGSNDFGGYTIISSSNERNRRIVHWFYRNIKAPTLDDWEECIYLFDLQEVPMHILQLYNHDKEPLNKFIIIHDITNEYIRYTYENKDNNESNIVTVPLGLASLVPERFLFNLKMYCDTKN